LHRFAQAQKKNKKRRTMSTEERVSAVTNHTIEYIHRCCTWRADSKHFEVRGLKCTRRAPDATARVLLAAGRGPARLPSCEYAVRHGRMNYTTEGSATQLDARPLLRRALLLFRAGELRALCVAEPDVIDFVVSVLQPELDPAAVPNAAAPSPGLAALGALRTVAWTSQPNQLDAAFALIERHAATMTTLDCRMWGESDVAERALARCTRLQSLSWTRFYAPTSWLQCAQLHTLRGVDLGQVSVATIAAALPRLHTFTAVIRADDVPAEVVAGFFDDLLPRLRVFHFSGRWPSSRSRQDATGIVEHGQPPLPRLQELVWQCPLSHNEVARRFIGAQPVTLDTSHKTVADWLSDANAGGGERASVDGMAAGGGPLARVRDLRVAGVGRSDTSDVARMLRAAPHLRRMEIIGFRGTPFWDTTVDTPSDDPFAATRPTHGRIQSILIKPTGGPTRVSNAADTVTRLREQQHFPCLRELIIPAVQCCGSCRRLRYGASCPADCGGWWCPHMGCRTRCDAGATRCHRCNAAWDQDE
jgi:hypothetical protein